MAAFSGYGIFFLLLAASSALARPLQGNEMGLGAVQELNTTYHVLIRTGDERPDPFNPAVTHKLGALIDKNGKPVLSESDGTPRVANNPDFSSFLKKNGDLYSVVQFETGPAAFYVMGLDMNKEGHMKVVDMVPVDMNGWGGALRPCAGSVTPWESHLSAEEADPNMRAIETRTVSNTLERIGNVREIMAWHGVYCDQGNAAANAVITAKGYTLLPSAAFNDLAKQIAAPYMNGHIIDIDIKNGRPSFTKYMTMGRSSWEIAYILPDRRTVYLNDDAGNSGGFVKFVASQPGDMSKGALYAAKLTQTNAIGSPSADLDIEWIKMSDVDQDIILAQAQRPLGEFKFSDIFLYMAPVQGVCTDPTFVSVTSNFGHECLKMNAATPNVAMLGAALETRRMITYVGASSQLSKLEGLTFSPELNKLYVAISFQQRSMLPNNAPYDVGGKDEVGVLENSCGCTYAVDLDKDLSATRMYAQICGHETVWDAAARRYVCDITKPANPDNLSYMDNFGWLIICEDSGSPQKAVDLLWAHHVVTGETIRIGAAEAGAEVAAGYWYDRFSGYSYLTANYQSTDHSDAPIGYMGPWVIKSKSITFQEAPNIGFEEAKDFRYADGPYAQV